MRREEIHYHDCYVIYGWMTDGPIVFLRFLDSFFSVERCSIHLRHATYWSSGFLALLLCPVGGAQVKPRDGLYS